MNSGAKNNKHEQGQSTVEFGLVLILLMSFTLFFIRLALVFGFGNFVQYATFMSARAYLSAGVSPTEQSERATDIILATVKKKGNGKDKYPWIAQGEGGSDILGLEINHPEYKPGVADSSWMQGVRYTFKSRLFAIPFGGLSSTTDKLNQLKLTSESWLGREPSQEECVSDLEKKRGTFDNGC